MKRTMSWALGAVLLLTCTTAVWSQTTSPSPQDKPDKPDEPGKHKPPTGTITGVIAGTDLTGGGTTGTVTLNLDTTKVPQLGAANTFTASQSVNGSITATNVSATGTVTGGVVNAANVNVTGAVNSGVVSATTSFDIGGTPFAFGSYGNWNAFLGFSGNAYTTSNGNTGSGFQALASNTTGNFNTASGYQALYSNTTACCNAASGVHALYSNTTGSSNTASGANALYFNTIGFANAANGVEALYKNDTGYYNTASGDSALYFNTTGNSNTASGMAALQDNTTGNFNTASGAQALLSNTTGTFLTCVGSYCSTSVDGLTNATAIGAFATVGQSNALVLGSIYGVNSASASVNVGIGTTTPSNVFTIGQGAGHAVADGWDTYSSRRLKTNIHTLHDALAIVEQLRGVSYDLKANGKHEVGVIAEEVGAVVPEVVTWDKNGHDAQSVDYGRLTALLIEATKEQQELIREQQEQIKAQQTQLSKLTSELGTIQVLLKSGRRDDARVRTVRTERTTVGQ